MGNWEKNVRKVHPYTPGEQPKGEDVIKLNTNENPYPPSPKVKEALLEFDADILRKYPDPTVSELTNALAEYFHLKNTQIFTGVGSDDVLAMCYLTFFNSDVPILFPNITYSFYDVWAEEFRVPYETKALDEHFRIRPSDYKCRNGGIILPNPNAPTGEFEEIGTLEDIIAANPDSVVIIDEAYVNFKGTSASVLPLIDTYDNLLVVQTFSKSRSLAGSRIGYALGNEKLIACLNDVKYSFNSYTIDALTIKLAVASLSDEEYFKETVKRIIYTREWTKDKLTELGFSYPDSQANFIFATHESIPAKEIFEALRKENIYVRYFDKPLIDNYLRITVGTEKEMQKFIAFLEKFIKERI